MTERTLLFAQFTDTFAPGTGAAWGPGNSNPAFPSGYTLMGDPPRISGGQFTKYSGSASALIWDDTPLTGDIIEAEVNLGTVGSDSEGPCLGDPTGVGFQVLSNTSNGVRLFRMTAGGVLSTQISTAGTAMASGSRCRMRYIQSTDTVQVYDDDVLHHTWTGVTSDITNWRAGAFARNAGAVVSLKSIYTAAQTITSINGGNPIVVGQPSIVVEHEGYGGAITSITTNRDGLTATVISGDADSTTFSISDWDDSEQYPELDSDVTFTFSRSGESASDNQTVIYPENWAKVTFSNPINDDERMFTYIFSEAGFTTLNAVCYYDAPAVTGLVLNSDGSGDPLDEGGTFGAWLRPVDGAGAGEMHYFLLAIEEDGGAVISPGLFTSVDFAQMGSLIESNAISVGDSPLEASITGSGAEYSIDSGSGFLVWQSTPQAVPAESDVKVRILSPSSPGQSRSCVLNLGDESKYFTITTSANADTGASIMVVNGNNPVEAGENFTITFDELNAADVMLVVLEKGSQTYYATIVSVDSATQLTALAPENLPADDLVTVRVYESKHARNVRDQLAA